MIMKDTRPIIILEDDTEEHELLSDAMSNVGIINPLKFFTDGEEFLNYLTTTIDNPLIIFSAINLQKMDGVEVRRQIQSNEFLKSKAIPYVFFTVKDDKKIIEEAYDLTVQGYFIKGSTMEALEKDLRLIVDYWKKSRQPNEH